MSCFLIASSRNVIRDSKEKSTKGKIESSTRSMLRVFWLSLLLVTFLSYAYALTHLQLLCNLLIVLGYWLLFYALIAVALYTVARVCAKRWARHNRPFREATKRVLLVTAHPDDECERFEIVDFSFDI